MKNYFRNPFFTLSTCALIGVCTPTLSAQNARLGVSSIVVKDYLGKDRTILDTDGDGWDDLWCHLNPELKHWSKSIDTDGDKLTDYEEMIMWRDPYTKGPIPRDSTPEEIEAARLGEIEGKRLALEEAKRLWPERAAELAKTVQPTFAAGKDAVEPEEVANDNAALRAKLIAHKNKADAEKNQKKQELEAIFRKYDALDKQHGFKRENKGTIVGEDASGPIIITPQDATSANTINADDLWPAGLYPFQNTSLTRNLTGLGIKASVFEANETTTPATAGILSIHSEFNGGRAVQIDGGAASNHGTAVANVMVGGGILDVFRNSTNLGKQLRGVAYQGQVEGYNLNNFTVNSSSITLNNQSFSNHSYGVSGGWSTIANNAGQVFWFWPNSAFFEDPLFGTYSPASSTSGSLSSAELDSFVKLAEVHLPVYASGNPRGFGPGAAPSVYVTRLPDQSLVFATVIRDWVNGDDGYDTVLSPATAKNVLSVGSITDFDGLGYTLSNFSGTGPTDDGRIKPDLVAVGQRNSGLGFGNSLFCANKVNTTGYYNGIIADTLGNIELAGTSFAAPSVSGGLMLAEQRRKQLLPTAGRLLASTWRAASINSATDVEAVGPDYLKGWGIFNAEQLVSTIEKDVALGRGSLIKEFTINLASPKIFHVKLPANTTGELTLAWNDPAGNSAPLGSVLDGQTPMLVNNIDMVVQDVATSTNHLPWVLNPDLNGESAALRGTAATRGTDNRNNVEKITIDPAAQERRLKITISPNGALQGGSQKISLILSGIALEAPIITSSSFTQNPSNMDEYGITFSSDPGAFYTLESSMTLEAGS